MWLSSTAQQAVHAVLCIAQAGEHSPVRVDELASIIGCPRNYLSKTLHILTRARVLKSGRGRHGGFSLAAPPEKLTLARVVAPFERAGQRRCLIGRATCGDANPCAAHHRWKKVASEVDDYFRKTTIAALMDGNARATADARAAILSFRNTSRRSLNGSAA